MSFLHLWAIPIGVAAMSLPLLVHWLTKPKPTWLPLSTIRFVFELVHERRARNRLRDWLILLFRAAAIFALAMMIARPLSHNSPLSASNQPASALAKIVVLDVSQSMAATSQGIQAMQRARTIAARQVAYASNTHTNLILAAATPHPAFDRPSNNFSMLLDQVTKADPLPHRLNVQAALNSAAEMLSNVDAVRRELVFISDFQRSQWAAADFSVLPADTVIQLESVAPAEAPANVAILAIRTQGRVEQERPCRIEIEIGNYSTAPRQVTVELQIGEQVIRAEGQCPEAGKTTLMAETTFASEGWHMGEARLVGLDDALNEDNRRALAFQVYPKPTYLLLTRQSADAKPSSSYFLERAISPNSASAGTVLEHVIRADPLRVTRESIMKADLLVLDHPGKLSDETIQLLSALVLRGRGLLYVVAEPIDATNLKLLTKEAGSSLQAPVEFSPPIAGQARKNLFIADLKRRESPFKVFGEDASAILAPVRFNGGLASRRVDGTLYDDVLATFNDQSACLVVTACGAGSIAILNTDLASSTLPSSPAFVPMVGELTSQLLGRDRSSESADSGEPLAVYLPPSASPAAGLRIESSTGNAADQENLGELREESVGLMWQSRAIGPPGVYEVKRGQQTVFAMPAGIPAQEADLTSIASDVLTNRLSGGRNVTYRSALQEEQPRDDAWTWLAVACLCCLFAEIVGLKVFKS